MTEDRAAYRHGHTAGEVTLGGRRVQVSRPRVRSVAEGQEIALATYRQFTARDPLCEVMFGADARGGVCP